MFAKDEAIGRVIPAKKLKELLSRVPDDALIAVSPVLDLLVLNSREKPQGLIMLASEEYDPDLFTNLEICAWGPS